MLQAVHDVMLVRGGSGARRPGSPRKPLSRRGTGSSNAASEIAVDPTALAADWATTIAVAPVFTTCLGKLSMKVVLPLPGATVSDLGLSAGPEPGASDPAAARSTSVLLSCILRDRDAVVAARAEAVGDGKWRKRGLMSWMRSFTPPTSQYRVQLQLQTSELPADPDGEGPPSPVASPGSRSSRSTGGGSPPQRSTSSPGTGNRSVGKTKKRRRRLRAPPCAAWRASRHPAGLLVAEDEWLLCTILGAGTTRDLALSGELSARGLLPLVAVAAHINRSRGPSPPVEGAVFSHGLPTMLGTGLGAHICGATAHANACA